MADGGNHISRTVYVILCLWVTYTTTLSLTDTAAWMWVLCVLTMLPTNTLLTAIHGIWPKRKDGRWQLLQDAAIAICNKWPVLNLGVVYGAVRASLILPAALWIGEPWLVLCLLQGALYWVCGRISQQWAARMSEGVSGAFVGLLITTH